MRKQDRKIATLLTVLLLGMQTAGCGEKTAEVSMVSSAEEHAAEITQEETAEGEFNGSGWDEGESLAKDDNAVDWGAYGEEDTFFEQLIRIKTGIYDRELTPEDLQTVEEFTWKFDDGRINGIQAIEHMTNLKVLTVDPGADYLTEEVLAEMQNLEELKLDMSSRTALPDLKNLKVLTLEGREWDPSLLQNLTNLTSLTLIRQDPNVLNGLSGLTNLTSLSLEIGLVEESVLDLSALEGLANGWPI